MSLARKNLSCYLNSFGDNTLKSRKILIHPQPLENELLSSWFCRMAIKNLTLPSTFFNLHFGNLASIFSFDFDWPKKELIENISKKVGFSIGRILSLTLKSYDGYLFESQNKFSSNKSFVNPVNFRGGKNRNYGLRYCPYCLREKGYFRKEWRLTFSTACPKHKVFLLDRCPQCGEPLTLQKWRKDKLEFHCWKCGFEFKKAESEKISNESNGINAIKSLYNILEKGYFEFDREAYYSIAYFKVLAHFVKIVYNWRKREYNLLRMEEEIINIRLPDKTKSVTYYSIPLKKQYLLFSVLVDILSSKENLEKFIIDNRLKKTELTRDFLNYPFWYKEFVDKYNEKTYSPTTQEMEEIINFLHSHKSEINWKNIRMTTGKFLDKRKREDIRYLMEKGFENG